ncbi:MAG TPA: methionine--tRNA ligase [Candidatus Dormibacteraeota bacterium]
MPGRRIYVTTTLPYVNARPHLGFALELVQADAFARHHRQLGDQVRLLTGTDDNSLKNVLAAEAAGIPTAELVARNAARFAALHDPLDLAFDDFIRTADDPRHRPGVERLWRAAAAAGDLYRRHYEGLYCVGCEQFYAPDELVGGRCPEHGTAPDLVAEENWFFRLSRYQRELERLIVSGRLRILPEFHAREVLAFVRSGLRDFSISRSRERARGWGIPVPGDPDQVIYVWWDALGNYVNALGYGTGDDRYRRWWLEASERVHVLGKGVLRFHAVYWPAMCLSAGVPPPTTLLVHQYLTAGGRKLSKSLGNGLDPGGVVTRFGADALRWWLLREVPAGSDADFTVDRLVALADNDLAGGLGNLVQRTAAMVHRYRGGRVPDASAPGPLADRLRRLTAEVGAAVDAFDFRAALTAFRDAVDDANRLVNAARPWELARAGEEAELDSVLATLVAAGRELARQAEPFVPALAGRVRRQLGDGDPELPPPAPVFPRLGGARSAP